MQDATDHLSAVFGNDQASLLVNTPWAFNNLFNSSWNASGITLRSCLCSRLADDTYQVGLMGHVDFTSPERLILRLWRSTRFLTPGAPTLKARPSRASWYVVNTAANGLPDANGRVLIMQVTTLVTSQVKSTTKSSHSVWVQTSSKSVWRLKVEIYLRRWWANACGCTDATAVNYDETAQYDDGSCEYECSAVRTRRHATTTWMPTQTTVLISKKTSGCVWW